MKVLQVVNGESEPKEAYPYVIKFPSGTMALITASGRGFCIKVGEEGSKKVGEYFDDWIEENGELWHGAITLEF